MDQIALRRDGAILFCHHAAHQDITEQHEGYYGKTDWASDFAANGLHRVLRSAELESSGFDIGWPWHER
jgi:hypothetical protein